MLFYCVYRKKLDPTESIATRPLFTTGSGNRRFFYTCDGNKNVSELVHFETRNGIAATTTMLLSVCSSIGLTSQTMKISNLRFALVNARQIK